MSLAPGQTILDEKYHIVRLIGEGGAARIWLAEEPSFAGRPVAIKELRRDRLAGEDLVEQERRFRQEVRLATLLEQAGVPHVVRAYTVETLPDGSLLLVMEFVAGDSLADLLARNPQGLPIGQALKVASQVAEALAGLHELPVEAVHRDVKPSNILLTASGEARLADFGLAQLAGESNRSHLAGRRQPGTPLYMAPEQETSFGYLTPAADLYALGCVLFEMLTGQRYKRLAPGTSARTLRPAISAALDVCLAKMLEQDPWQRWQSARELAEALRETELPGRQDATGRRPDRQSRAEKKMADDTIRATASPPAAQTGEPAAVVANRRHRPGIRFEERPASRALLSPGALIGGALVLIAVIALLLWATGFLLTP